MIYVYIFRTEQKQRKLMYAVRNKDSDYLSNGIGGTVITRE